MDKKSNWVKISSPSSKKMIDFLAEEETMNIKSFGDFVDECASWWGSLEDVASVDVEDTAPDMTVFIIALRNGRELLVEITER